MTSELMELILASNQWLNDLVWGPPFMTLLVGTGIYLTLRLGFFQFTHLGFAWRRSFGLLFSRRGDQEESPDHVVTELPDAAGKKERDAGAAHSQHLQLHQLHQQVHLEHH